PGPARRGGRPAARRCACGGAGQRRGVAARGHCGHTDPPPGRSGAIGCRNQILYHRAGGARRVDRRLGAG
nr:hypothetical protein [Tanacetum cinerariifolium]